MLQRPELRSEWKGYQAAAFSLYGVPLENFIYETPGYENYRLTKFAPTEYNNRGSLLLGAEFDYEGHDCSWEVVLDKESGVVLAYTICELKGTPNVQWRRGEIQFQFDQNGDFPTLTGYTMWDEVGQKRTKYNEAAHTVVELSRKRPKADIFYPSSIGIDVELGKRSLFWWFIASALILVTIVGFTRYSKRK